MPCSTCLVALFFGTEQEWCESGEEVHSVSIQVSDHPASEIWDRRGEDTSPWIFPGPKPLSLSLSLVSYVAEGDILDMDAE